MEMSFWAMYFAIRGPTLDAIMRLPPRFQLIFLDRNHLKIRILFPDQGGRAFGAAGIHRYFEDSKRASNADMGPKDFFETCSTV
jgi:hypothetical protein